MTLKFHYKLENNFCSILNKMTNNLNEIEIKEIPPVKSQLDLIEKNQQEVNELQDILKENIDKIVDRGCNLNQLNDSCDSLDLEANQFKTNAVRLKRHFICKNNKWTIIVIILVLLVLLVIGVAVAFIISKFILKN